MTLSFDWVFLFIPKANPTFSLFHILFGVIPIAVRVGSVVRARVAASVRSLGPLAPSPRFLDSGPSCRSVHIVVVAHGRNNRWRGHES